MDNNLELITPLDVINHIERLKNKMKEAGEWYEEEYDKRVALEEKLISQKEHYLKCIDSQNSKLDALEEKLKVAREAFESIANHKGVAGTYTKYATQALEVITNKETIVNAKGWNISGIEYVTKEIE